MGGVERCRPQLLRPISVLILFRRLSQGQLQPGLAAGQRQCEAGDWGRLCRHERGAAQPGLDGPDVAPRGPGVGLPVPGGGTARQQ